MKILYSPASPYSSKVRMAAQFTGLAFDSEIVSTAGDNALLANSNPLGKIPVLITDDGHAVYDSRSIMHYLDRVSDGKLYPASHAERTRAEVMEALGDGIIDCLIVHLYERRFHPPEKVHEPWLEKQWSKVANGLDFLEKNVPDPREGPHGGHFSIASLAGYLPVRFSGLWEERWPWISAYAREFEAIFPAFANLKPYL